MRRAIQSTMLAALCLVASACGRPQADAEVQRVRDGVAAFRAGDREALTDLLRTARNYQPDRNACSRRSFAESRREAATGLLASLDRDDLFAVSEEARFAYLARRARHVRLADLPRPLACDGVSRRTLRRDFAERRTLIGAYADTAAVWRRDLETRYGETELRQRLLAADDTLRVNHVGGMRLGSNDPRRLRRLAAWTR